MRDLGRELEDRKRPVTLFFLFKTLEAPKSWVRLRCKRTISDAKKKKKLVPKHAHKRSTGHFHTFKHCLAFFKRGKKPLGQHWLSKPSLALMRRKLSSRVCVKVMEPRTPKR